MLGAASGYPRLLLCLGKCIFSKEYVNMSDLTARIESMQRRVQEMLVRL